MMDETLNIDTAEHGLFVRLLLGNHQEPQSVASLLHFITEASTEASTEVRKKR
jgi:hypothetical protein